MSDLHLTIGGLPTRVVMPDAPVAETLRDRYAAFLTAPSLEGSTIVVELIDASLEAGYRVPTIDVSGDDFTVTRHDFHAHSPDHGRTWRVRMIANEYTFDSCLRVLYTLRLSECGGFLVHASAQLRRGLGCIFTGKSEAGKTTISRLGAENVVLCDELPLVRKIDGRYLVWGTPFWGEFVKGRIAASGEVAALFFLIKAPFNRVERVSVAKAVPRLLQTTLFFSRDPTFVDAAMRHCADFLRRVPAFDLHFLPETTVWEAVDEALDTLPTHEPDES